MTPRQLADWLCIRGILLLMKALSQQEEDTLIEEVLRYRHRKALRVVEKRL